MSLTDRHVEKLRDRHRRDMKAWSDKYAELEAEAARLRADRERFFRWAYRAVVELAKAELEVARPEEGSRDWPGAMKWTELVGSSHAIFMRRARYQCGIPDDEWLAVIRGADAPDFHDIYYAAAGIETEAP